MLTISRCRGLLVAACTVLAMVPFAWAQQPTQTPGKVPTAKAPEKQPAAASSKAVNGQKRNLRVAPTAPRLSPSPSTARARCCRRD